MVDVAAYPSQGTLTFQDCGNQTLDNTIEFFMQQCRTCCAEKGLDITVQRNEFKTSNAARKMGGLVSFVGKMVQKSSPGFTIESKAENYRIHLVGGQYMDEISFEVFFFTGFNIERNVRKREYCKHKFEIAADCVRDAYNSMTE